MPFKEQTMPRKPKRPCSHPGCPGVTEEQFCEVHKKLEAKRYEKYDRDLVAKRKYGRSHWKRLRNEFLLSHPFCEMCLKEGVMTKANEVHHIRPLSIGGGDELDNLMAICTPCHSRITSREGGRWKSQTIRRGY